MLLHSRCNRYMHVLPYEIIHIFAIVNKNIRSYVRFVINVQVMLDVSLCFANAQELE